MDEFSKTLPVENQIESRSGNFKKRIKKLGKMAVVGLTAATIAVGANKDGGAIAAQQSNIEKGGDPGVLYDEANPIVSAGHLPYADVKGGFIVSYRAPEGKEVDPKLPYKEIIVIHARTPQAIHAAQEWLANIESEHNIDPATVTVVRED